MDTFKKEIVLKYRKEVNGVPTAELENVTKSATFKELSQFSKEQAGLIFSLTSLITSSKKNNIGVLVIDSDSMYETAQRVIKELLIIDDEFKESDKALFLLDTLAQMYFINWYLTEKFMPFFASSVQS